MNLKRAIHLTIVFSVLSLAAPFVWLKIGPNGYAYYGPSVPDIYILGSTVLGKDRSVDAIYFPFTFQLCFILYFIFNTCRAYLKVQDIRLVRKLMHIIQRFFCSSLSGCASIRTSLFATVMELLLTSLSTRMQG
jgi:hypothetical protein